MNHNSTTAVARPVIRSVVVPYSLYSAISAANMSMMDLFVFDRLRKIASLEDVAVFAYLNQSLTINDRPIGCQDLKKTVILGSGSKAEFDGVFGKMMHTDEIKQLAKSLIAEKAFPMSNLLAVKPPAGAAVALSAKQSRLQQKPTWIGGDLAYQLKTSGSNVFVVVGCGFSKYVGASRSDEAIEFVRDFLQSCTGLFSPSEVARHPLFKFFLLSTAG